MEKILRSKEMAQIKLIPVRHHSPACALHVKKVIEAWKPDAILIEGPDNANAWIPVMVDQDTRAPFAVYYSYDDKAGLVTEEKEKYKCYYPFLDYSPELVALRTGKEQGIYTAFIDMPYGDILVASTEGKGLLKEVEKSNYNDDYLLSQSTYVKMLCERTGMRSFDEFWEKYFELEGLHQDSEVWFQNLLIHCTLSREYSSRQELLEEGCLHREAYMAERILDIIEKKTYLTNTQAVAENPRILVVTGGFHTPALAKLLEEEQEAAASEMKEKIKLPKVPVKDQGVYMMPYSMEAADALNGYASGMPFSGFYQEVWENICEQEIYEKTVLDFIIRSGKEVRNKEGGISTYDEICADTMAKGLASLRGKKAPGAYELQDAVLSAFVKGEYSLSTDLPMRTLRKSMTGNKIGELCKNANEPPILQDFRDLCKKYGLNITSTIGEDVTLAIFIKKKHRQMSIFFHRVTFLNTNFAKRVKGPNLQSGRDRNLMREIWKYKWNTQVMAALIDASVYGGTMEEAILGMVRQELKKELSAKEAALLLSQVFEMGLEEQLDTVYSKTYDLLLKDTDFYSLIEMLRILTMLQELSGLYRSQLDLQEMLSLCCRKGIGLLPSMTRIKEEDMTPCIEAIKILYRTTGRSLIPNRETLRESFLQALFQMLADKEIQAGINGCIYGILYGCGQKRVEEIEKAARGYLSGTREQLMRTAQFFRGLFFTAKDLVFVGNNFLQMLDTFLMEVPSEEFVKLLPELRLAFTYFTPGEIDRIAGMATALHGKKSEDILYQQGIPEEYLVYGRELEVYIEERIRAYDK